MSLAVQATTPLSPRARAAATSGAVYSSENTCVLQHDMRRVAASSACMRPA